MLKLLFGFADNGDGERVATMGPRHASQPRCAFGGCGVLVQGQTTGHAQGKKQQLQHREAAGHPGGEAVVKYAYSLLRRGDVKRLAEHSGQGPDASAFRGGSAAQGARRVLPQGHER